jgi:hypothetical protein
MPKKGKIERDQMTIINTVTPPNEGASKIIYLGACLIAAVRLAREERWDKLAARREQDCRCESAWRGALTNA